MHLFIIRHGECLGQTDADFATDPDSPLSPLGERQARRTAERLRDLQITHIISSPLIRSLGTAQIIAETLGFDEFDVWRDLREGFSGQHTGFGRATLMHRFPRASLPMSVRDDGWDHGRDRDYAHVMRRALDTLDALKRLSEPEDRFAVLTHGGFANALLNAILHIPLDAPQWFELANGSISHVRLVPDPASERPDWPLYPPVAAEVLSINDVWHVQDLDVS